MLCTSVGHVALGEIKSPAGANGALFDPLLLFISTVPLVAV